MKYRQVAAPEDFIVFIKETKLMLLEQLKDKYECLILSMQIILTLRKMKFGGGRNLFDKFHEKADILGKYLVSF